MIFLENVKRGGYFLKHNIKNVMMTCILGGVIAAGIGCATPETASAAPWVDLDYGESANNYWSVDIGSIKNDGNETTVMVELETAHDAAGARVYHFKYKKDHWVYMYDTWTGKGDFSEGIFWNRVSKSKLVNDVLYIVENH